MNADIRQVVAEFALSNDAANDAPFCLRAASRAWHEAVIDAIRFQFGSFDLSGSTAALRALLCPELVIDAAPPSVPYLCRAAMVWSPPGCLDLTPFVNLAVVQLPNLGMVGPVKNFSHGERIERLVLPPSMTSLIREGFSFMKMESVMLPPAITELGDRCFAGTEIAEFSFQATELRIVGMNCFNRFHTGSLDFSGASNLTALPQGCFQRSEMTLLRLPVGVTELEDLCFDRARIAELWLPGEGGSQSEVLGFLGLPHAIVGPQRRDQPGDGP